MVLSCNKSEKGPSSAIDGQKKKKKSLRPLSPEHEIVSP